MRRAALLVALAATALGGPVVSALADDDHSPPDPQNRIEAWKPEEPGTRKTIKLQYGPYTIHPGADLSRIDTEVVPADAYVIAAKPSVRFADGSSPSHTELHIHHAHWVWLDPDAPGGNRWFFGTGEEETEGGGFEYMEKDPRFHSQGLRWGIQLRKGDKLAFVSMLHNKTTKPMTVWLEGEMEIVYGAREDIRRRTGEDFRPITPVLHGTSFNVPRTGGDYVWPRDAPADDPHVRGSVERGVGHVWTAPFDGTIVIGAGHLHPGGKEVIVSNLGREDSPCDDGNAEFPGKTILRIQAYYRDGLFPSEEFQMGITQLGWRAKVRKGDRIAINGIYDASTYAYPDAMSFFGFYADEADPPAAGEECSVELLDRPDATMDEIVRSMPNKEWDSDALDVCPPGGCDDLSDPEPRPGLETNVVHMAGFAYAPGNLGTSGAPLGPPVVRRGEKLRFVNEDWGAGLVRHTATSCKAPCNGPYRADYPFHDGSFDTGVLGATLLDTYVTVRPEPTAEIDTSDLEPGRHTYYCRLHPSMRGSFVVEE